MVRVEDEAFSLAQEVVSGFVVVPHCVCRTFFGDMFNKTSGFDLQGNTFWEFKDALHALRNRRIAKYSRSTHYGDVKVSRSYIISSTSDIAEK